MFKGIKNIETLMDDIVIRESDTKSPPTYSEESPRHLKVK